MSGAVAFLPALRTLWVVVPVVLLVIIVVLVVVQPVFDRARRHWPGTIPREAVLSRDLVTLEVSAFVLAIIVDPILAVTTSADWTEALHEITVGAVRRSAEAVPSDAGAGAMTAGVSRRYGDRVRAVRRATGPSRRS
jgi:hypothetical protein